MISYYKCTMYIPNVGSEEKKNTAAVYFLRSFINVYTFISVNATKLTPKRYLQIAITTCVNTISFAKIVLDNTMSSQKNLFSVEKRIAQLSCVSLVNYKSTISIRARQK